MSVNMRALPFAPTARMSQTSPPPQDTARLDALLASVAEGDRTAFEALYREASSRLFGICLRLLSDRAEAEDVLQEVFVAIWNKAHQFDPARAGAAAWLSTIARNRAVDRLRASPARGALAPIDVAEDIPDGGASPLQTATAADDRARLDACMEQLEPRRRGLIRAAFFDGATYEELAERIASPLGSVKSWIRRGLLQLRGCLGE